MVDQIVKVVRIDMFKLKLVYKLRLHNKDYKMPELHQRKLYNRHFLNYVILWTIVPGFSLQIDQLPLNFFLYYI